MPETGPESEDPLQTQTPNKVDTKLGAIFINPTDASHLYVTERHDSANNFLTWRGCEYHVSAHFYRWRDGSYQIGDEFRDVNDPLGKRSVPTNAYDRRQSLYISNHAASESARNKIAEVLTGAVNTWAQANHTIIHAAHVEYLRGKVEDARADVEKARQELAKAEVALTLAEQNLRDAQAVRS